MPKKQKAIIFIVAGAALLCLVACGAVLLVMRNVGTAITNSAFKNPAEAAAAAQQIATLNPPAGYTPTEGMKILGMTMVIYKSNNSNVFIMLMELPTSNNLNNADITRMRETFNQQYGSRGYQMKVVDEKDITVRGQPGKVIISEGAANNVQVRQVIVYFKGNHGLAALFVTGPLSEWNTSAYDQMILSIR